MAKVSLREIAELKKELQQIRRELLDLLERIEEFENKKMGVHKRCRNVKNVERLRRLMEAFFVEIAKHENLEK